MVLSVLHLLDYEAHISLIVVYKWPFTNDTKEAYEGVVIL